MIPFFSKLDGIEYNEVLGGFKAQRVANLARGTSQSLGGHEERYLRNRALFASTKAAAVPVTRQDPDQENRFHFVDRKVLSA